MEIELKIPFNLNDLDSILDKLTTSIRYDEAAFVKKSDSLFTNHSDDEQRAVSSGGLVVRIREEGKLPKSAVKHIFREARRFNGVGSSAVFTTKIKTLVDGCETNVENELKIDDPDELSKCLYIMGYHIWFNKVKYSYGFYTVLNGHNYHIELERVCNEVNGKNVLYIEIENTESDNYHDKDIIVSDEKSILEDLGLNPDNVDNRPWVEILGK